jgi:hypothetical protein
MIDLSKSYRTKKKLLQNFVEEKSAKVQMIFEKNAYFLLILYIFNINKYINTTIESKLFGHHTYPPPQEDQTAKD